MALTYVETVFLTFFCITIIFEYIQTKPVWRNMSYDLQNGLNRYVFSESRFFLQARPCKRPLVGIPYCSIEFNSTIQRTNRQTDSPISL